MTKQDQFIKKHGHNWDFMCAAIRDESYAQDMLKRNPRLLEADVNGSGETPLIYLAVEDRYEACEFLIKLGANVNALTNNGTSGFHDVVIAASLKTIKLFLDNGANPNTIGFNSQSCLSTATDNNDYQLMQLLLDYNADPNFRHTSTNDYPLGIAVRNKDTKLAQFLINAGANPNIDLSHPDSCGSTFLHNAIEQYDIDMVKLLINAGADVNQPVYHEMQITPIISALFQLDLDITTLLIKHGSDINYQLTDGHTFDSHLNMLGFTRADLDIQ
ncbi:ankyrin repeat domain-containing protein [Planctomycetota bacterium]|nr:ankyrin repeat domain-containing protein [Planctomycetota bacterium]